MKVNLINIGYGNIVAANRIISIIGPESAPVKRIIQDAKEAKKFNRCNIWQEDSFCDYHGQRTCHIICCATRNSGQPN